MWVMGGRSSSTNYLYSSEFITQENAVPGPNMPTNIAYHCAVKYNESHVYAIGGFYHSGSYYYHYNDVYIFNPLENFSSKSGPEMNYRRKGHGCAVMNDGESSVIVVAGGYGYHKSYSDGSYNMGNPLNKVEILDPSSGQWNMGKKSHIKSKYTIEIMNSF